MKHALPILVVLLAACSGDGGDSDDGQSGFVARGRALFARNGCQTCHGDQGRGDGGLAASLTQRPRDFRDRSAYRNGYQVEEIAASIAEGLPPAMPAYSHLSGQTRLLLARCIASLQVEGFEEVAGAMVRVEAAWARAALPPHQTAAVFMVLRNESSAEAALVGAVAEAADRVEFHLTSNAGDMMQMRRVGQLAIPAWGNLQLVPGRLHLMLSGLRQPLLAGSRLPLRLQFADGEEIAVEAQVRQP